MLVNISIPDFCSLCGSVYSSVDWVSRSRSFSVHTGILQLPTCPRPFRRLSRRPKPHKPG